MFSKPKSLNWDVDAEEKKGKSLVVEIPKNLSNGDTLLSKIARTYSKNKCGNINYNKYGQKLGNSFVPVSDIFCDNFILYVHASTKHIRNGVFEYVG